MKNLAILIAVDDYIHFGNLRYTKNDAIAFSKILKHHFGFRKSEIIVMGCDRKSDFSARFDKVKDLLKKTREAEALDMLVFGFWGHGVNDNGQRYLCLQDSRTDLLEKSALMLSEVIDKLKEIDTRNSFVLLDCCQTDLTRGFNSNDDAFVMQQSEIDAIDKFVNVIAKTGADTPQTTNTVILSACRERQHAHELEEKKHGLFTAGLIQAFTCGHSSLAAVAGETKRLVSEWALRKQWFQTPYSKSEGDIEIPFPRKSGHYRWLLALLFLVIIGFVYVQGTNQSQTTIERPSPTLSISSRTPDVSVSIDGILKGQTPINITDLAVGKQFEILAFKEGYESIDRNVMLGYGETRQLDLGVLTKIELPKTDAERALSKDIQFHLDNVKYGGHPFTFSMSETGNISIAGGADSVTFNSYIDDFYLYLAIEHSSGKYYVVPSNTDFDDRLYFSSLNGILTDPKFGEHLKPFEDILKLVFKDEQSDIEASTGEGVIIMFPIFHDFENSKAYLLYRNTAADISLKITFSINWHLAIDGSHTRFRYSLEKMFSDPILGPHLSLHENVINWYIGDFEKRYTKFKELSRGGGGIRKFRDKEYIEELIELAEEEQKGRYHTIYKSNAYKLDSYGNYFIYYRHGTEEHLVVFRNEEYGIYNLVDHENQRTFGSHNSLLSYLKMHEYSLHSAISRELPKYDAFEPIAVPDEILEVKTNNQGSGK